VDENNFVKEQSRRKKRGLRERDADQKEPKKEGISIGVGSKTEKKRIKAIETQSKRTFRR